jgi:energy-converting hydrogenase Eha subunit A
VELQGLVGYVLFALQVAVLVAAVYAFVHAAMQRPDAYTAADKLTKPVWLVILGVGILLALVLGITGVAIAAVAAGVYLVDVRPKILEIQGKSR